MAPRSRRRSSRRPAVLEDAASGLAREVIRRRSRASRAAPARRAEGDGRGMAIRDAADVAKWAKGRIAELEHEEAWVLVIDRQHRLVRARRIERGDTGTTHLDPSRTVDAAAIRPSAGFILVHNHPSDIPKPGEADVDATKQVMQLAGRRKLRMLDSVIVGRTTHSSLRDLGLMS